MFQSLQGHKVKTLKRSNLRFFLQQIFIGEGGLGVTRYDPLKFPNMAPGFLGSSLQISAERVALREGPSLGAAAITSLRRGNFAKGNWRKFHARNRGSGLIYKDINYRYSLYIDVLYSYVKVMSILNSK